MVIYSVVFILLYATGAYFSGNVVTFLILLGHRNPYSIEIVYMIVINLVTIVFYWVMQSYGKRKGWLNAPLIICLCVVDFLFFGLNFLGLTVFLFSGSLGDFVERIFTSTFDMNLPILCYWMLAYYVFHRTYITVHYFKKLKGQGDG